MLYTKELLGSMVLCCGMGHCLSGLYASESEDRAADINAVLDICYTQPDQRKGRRMNLPSSWVISASERPFFPRTT